MARQSVQELETAVLEAVQELGDVEYSTLANELTDTGYSAALPLLRSMKHNGQISMRLERGEDGVLRHIVGPAQGEGIPF